MSLTASSAIKALGGTGVVSAELGLPANTVSTWRKRGIPAHRWPALVRLAEAKGCSQVTFEALAAIPPVMALASIEARV